MRNARVHVHVHVHAHAHVHVHVLTLCSVLDVPRGDFRPTRSNLAFAPLTHARAYRLPTLPGLLREPREEHAPLQRAGQARLVIAPPSGCVGPAPSGA